jgi:WD40 repeat protein
MHAQVCGLRWSPDDREVASGGNDNQLYIWGLHSTAPTLKFSDHTAAVKAIAWSPHQHGLLASGGGTADRCIRFWNTATGATLSHIDTGAFLDVTVQLPVTWQGKDGCVTHMRLLLLWRRHWLHDYLSRS